MPASCRLGDGLGQHMKRIWLGIWAGATALVLPIPSPAQGLEVVLGPITNPAAYSSQGAVEYLVQAAAAGNGAVSGDTNNWVASGSNASLTATPAEYYEFDRWDDGIPTAAREFPVFGPTNLTASFKKLLDADGVAEDWKANNSITNVWEDTDKDGALDIEEYFADTNPNRDDDFFRLVRFNGGGGEQVGLPGSSSNCQYDILGSGDLQDGGWNSLTNFPGTGSPVYIDPGAPGMPPFFGGKARRVNP